MSFHQSVNNFVFHSIKYVAFHAKEGVFAGNFTALIYLKEIYNWGTQNSCWNLWWLYSVEKKHLEIGSKIIIFMLKIKNALAHQKSLKMKNRRHYFMKTYIKHKLNLQNH